jgi:hypothetical protein
MVGSSLKTYKKVFTAGDYTPWVFSGIKERSGLEGLPPCVFG